MEKFPARDDGFTVESEYLSAHFSTKTGFLQWIKMADEPQPRRVEVEFVHYGTTRSKDKSGAYLFLPSGQAKPVPSAENEVIFLDGPLTSSVTVQMPVVSHTVTVAKIRCKISL